MKAVLYARFSSDKQSEQSVEGQIRECKTFAEHKGMKIVGSFVDRAMSAKSDKRPEFQRMIKESANGAFDVVLVWKLDRFARNRYDSAHYKAILRKNGVRVVSTTEAIAEDATGILLESLLEGYAEFFSAELAEKVTRGMTENALKCKFNGGTIPFGYQISAEQHYELNPITAPIVSEIFQRYASGDTITEIIESLNAQGVKTGKGGAFNKNSLHRMFNNRRYLGEYHFDTHVVPGGIPTIITQDIFDKVQERMAKNKHSPARFKATDDYLLTDKLYCGKDGEKMVGDCGRGKKGVTYYYYKCVNAKKRICDKKTVRKQYVEDYVILEVMKMLHDEELVEQMIDAVFDLNSQRSTALPLLEKQLKETQKAIGNMLNAIQAGIFNESTKQRLDELEQSKKDTEVAILQEKISKPTLTKEKIKCWITKWRDIDPENEKQRQKLVDIFVNVVYDYDDEWLIILNYKDGEVRVTLEEVNAALAERAKAQASNACLDMVVNGSPTTFKGELS